MHLEDHRASEILLTNSRINTDHRHLDHICCCSLDRHIHRFSLSNRSLHLVRIIDPLDGASTTEVGLYISHLSRISKELIIVSTHSGVSCIEGIDILIRFPWRAAESLRESESGDAIDHSEIHGLRYASLFIRDLAIRKDVFRRTHMDILSLLECFEKPLILREECEYSEFDLRIVGYDEYMVFTGNEAGLDHIRISLPGGDILEIGIIRAHASRRCPELPICSMDSSCLRIYRFRESLDIGRVKLRKGTVFEYESRDIMCLRDLFEHFRIDRESCLILAKGLDAELLEEDDLYLFRRIDIEKFTDDIIDLDLIFSYLFTDTLSDLLEIRPITAYSCVFHLSEYRKEFCLHVLDESSS